MHFYKLYTYGRNYIYVDNENDANELDAFQIKNICDAVRGAGTDGIFTICRNEAKKPQIRAFDKNGVIMRDLTSVAVCAALGSKITGGKGANDFYCKKGHFFTYISHISDENYLVSCDMGKGYNLFKNDVIERKTELGNRILTLTAVYSGSAYTVHFSSCANSLNRVYLSEKNSALSLFGEKTSLIICEEEEKNAFRVLPLYENGEDAAPCAGAVGAVGIAACLTGKSDFLQEICVKYKNDTAYAVCKNDLSVAVHLNAGIAFEGNIRLQN